jgi:hypothetical protein
MERCTVRSYLREKAADRGEVEEDEVETPRPKLVKSSGTRVPNVPIFHVRTTPRVPGLKGIVIRRRVVKDC